MTLIYCLLDQQALLQQTSCRRGLHRRPTDGQIRNPSSRAHQASGGQEDQLAGAASLPGTWLSAAAWPDTRGPCAPGSRLNLPAPRAGHWLSGPHAVPPFQLTSGHLIQSHDEVPGVASWPRAALCTALPYHLPQPPATPAPPPAAATELPHHYQQQQLQQFTRT